MPKQRGMRTAQTSRAMAIAMAGEDPEHLRKYVVEAGAPDWIDGLVASLKPRVYCSECKRPSYERWAFLLWAECAKLVGVTPQIQMLVVNQLGVSVPDAKRAVAAWNSVEGLTDEQLAESALDFARKYYKANGKEVLLVDGNASISSADGD
jgi:hypothetical protein